jgi:hypothetical protein
MIFLTDGEVVLIESCHELAKSGDITGACMRFVILAWRSKQVEGGRRVASMMSEELRKLRRLILAEASDRGYLEVANLFCSDPNVAMVHETTTSALGAIMKAHLDWDSKGLAAQINAIAISDPVPDNTSSATACSG